MNVHHRSGLCVFCLWVFILVPGGCETSKEAQLVDILEEIIDTMQEAFDDVIDIVDDNYDICNQCVRLVQAKLDTTRHNMRALREKYMAVRREVKDQVHFNAIKSIAAHLDKAYQQMNKKHSEKKAYKIFQEFNKNCGAKTGLVMKALDQIPRLYAQVMGMEFA